MNTPRNPRLALQLGLFASIGICMLLAVNTILDNRRDLKLANLEKKYGHLEQEVRNNRVLSTPVETIKAGEDYFAVPGEANGRFITKCNNDWFHFPYEGAELTHSQAWLADFLKIEPIMTASEMAMQARYPDPLPIGFDVHSKTNGHFVKFRKRV